MRLTIYLARHLWIVQGKGNLYCPQPNDDPYPILPPEPEPQIEWPIYPVPDLPGQLLAASTNGLSPSRRLYRPTTNMQANSLLADTLRWIIRSDIPTADGGPFRLFYAMDTKKLYMVIFGEWQMIGTLKHGLLDGLLQDQHPQYLNDTRHNDAVKHRLGDNVPHDSHGNLSGLDGDDHAHYLNEARHDITDRHLLGSVVPHDEFTGLTDAPSSYSGKAGQAVVVNSAEDSLEFQELNALGRFSDTVLPAASAEYRGQFFLVEGGQGIADEMYVCLKNAADTYEWQKITTSLPS